jgi:endonuclease/exonuclease/phosphatase family metal-dependent hydrolase
MKRLSIIFLSILLIIGGLQAQDRNFAVFSMAFYNVENLFDTEDDPYNPGDDDFLPTGAFNWTPAQYERKLDNLARVISRLGREHTPLGPAVIGICEVENRRVLEDLVSRPAIENMGLQIVHKESRDRRGIDLALLYNPRLFTVDNYRLHKVIDEENPTWVTRDHLVVSGFLADEKVHIIVCHWPSRRGGVDTSRLREIAATAVMQVVDSIQTIDENAKIVIMGDLNDDPADRSISTVLNAQRHQRDVQPGGLFNPMWNMHAQGLGTLVFQGRWNMFDQIIVSHSLLGDDFSTLTFWRAEIFNRDFLVHQTGRNRGAPFRSFQGTTFIGGYSDHFPVLIYLVREI